MLYGAPIWEQGLKLEKNRKIIKNAQKTTLARVAAAYRTVPLESLAALTGIIPWTIKIRERSTLLKWEMEIKKEIQSGRGEIRNSTRQQRRTNFHNEDLIYINGPEYIRPTTQDYENWEATNGGQNQTVSDEKKIEKYIKWTRQEIKKQTEVIWKQEWSVKSKNKWIYRFIKDPEDWNKIQGQGNFYTTQVITGHGVFGEYLKRIGKMTNMKCWYCEEDDTPEHTLLICPQWNTEREELFEKIEIGESNIEQDIVSRIADKIRLNKENWSSFTIFCNTVMGRKEDTEREIENNRETEIGNIEGRTTEENDMGDLETGLQEGRINI